LEHAGANRTLARETWDRDRPLVRDGWATQHQGDIDVQTLKAQEANVAIAQHNVAAQEKLLQTLRQNREYALVVAPFDGVITQRNVDVGSLVQGNATGGTFMFEIMQKDVIRVWVYVPQDAVDLPNPDGALRSGVYCMVELKIPRRKPSFIVPADAIIFNRNGLQVAVINDAKAEIRKVRVTRDFGTRVEVDTGVKSGDQVILNPPVNLVNGSKVEVRRRDAVVTN
jgi:multidrug efflux pump subunit AcrA (membrane-fusion protein)